MAAGFNARVDAEIRPEPDEVEREALLAALREVPEADGRHRSAWRAAADQDESSYETAARPRSSRGASRA